MTHTDDTTTGGLFSNDSPTNNLTFFRFESATVRVIDQSGEPWFVASDVCRVLELANITMALRVLDDDERGVNTIEVGGRDQSVNIISEPGLYKLLSRSRKPEAKRFDRWVRHEVLPAIRKHGGYIVAAPEETPEALAIRALTILQATVARQKAQIEEAMPKVEALLRIATADGSLCITDAAKALQIRPKDLFELLQRRHWIYKRAGTAHWVGYQDRTSAGDIEHKVTTVLRPDGTEKITEQVRIMAQGLTKLARLMPERVTISDGGRH